MKDVLTRVNYALFNNPKSTVLLSCLHRATAGVLRSIGFLRIHRSAQSRKDTKMPKSKETKKRKSRFNPNRTCYLTADGKYYCYERWDDDAKCVVTQRLEVGKDLSLELTIMLDESDHDEDLKEYYARKARSRAFDHALETYPSRNRIAKTP